MAFADKTEKTSALREPVQVSDADFEAFWAMVQDRVTYAEHIDPQAARTWQEKVLNDYDTHPLEWYVRRMGNSHGPLVGGSEIGILLAARHKLPAPFGKTPGKLFDEKMMQAYMPSNKATRFGTVRESVVAAAFLEKVSKMGWQRDAEGLDALANHARDGNFIHHMAYSPDDLFLLPNGQRFLIDYKTPYSGVTPEKEPFSYVAQLHQGKLVLEEQCGLRIDGMMLVYGEHPESLAKPAQMNLHFYNVDFNQDLATEIPVAAREFAQALMDGVRPCVLEDQAVARLKQLDQEFVLLMAQIRDMEDRAQGLKAEMTEIVETLPAVDVAGAREETLATVAASYKVEDVDRLVALLQDAAPELFDDEKTMTAWTKKGVLDVDRVVAYLVEQKVDIHQFETGSTWDGGKIAKDARVIASGALDDALAQGIISRSLSWKVSDKAIQKAEQRMAVSPVLANPVLEPTLVEPVLV
ncbi:MAG: hypothetical protein ACYDCF_11445, partial [Burkholderiales bacterium]